MLCPHVSIVPSDVAAGPPAAARQLRGFSRRPRHREQSDDHHVPHVRAAFTGPAPGSVASAVGGPVATFHPTRNVQEDTLSKTAMRRKRFTAGVLAGAMALTVTPILGFTGTASALDTATGNGSVCAESADRRAVHRRERQRSQQRRDHAVSSTRASPPASPPRRTSPTARSPVDRWRCSSSASPTRRTPTTPARQVTALPAGDGVTTYTDISAEPADVKKAIDQLDEAGIANGTTATTFAPDAPVTRRQMAKFLVRLQTYLTGAGSVPTASKDYFTDDNGDSGEDELNILAEEGVFLGDGAGHVKPGRRHQPSSDGQRARANHGVHVRERRHHSSCSLRPASASVDHPSRTDFGDIVQTTTPGHHRPVHLRRGAHGRRGEPFVSSMCTTSRRRCRPPTTVPPHRSTRATRSRCW